MVVKSDELKTKLSLLGLAVAKEATASYKYKVIIFSSTGTDLYAYTYDGINNIKMFIGQVNSDVFAIIDYVTFTSFIKSCEGDITLDFKESFVHIKTATSKCKLSLINTVTSDKNSIVDPTCSHPFNNDFTKDIPISILKSILDTNHVVTSYQKVCFNDCIMVTDTNNVIIVNDRIFSKDILLNYSSIELLKSIHNIKYTFIKNKTPKMYITSDELDASIEVDLNEDNEFQYDDLKDLFDTINGPSVDINSKVLSKAMATSQLFKIDPIIEFNSNGIFLKIATVDFEYKISDAVCNDRSFILKPDVVKKIIMIGDTVKIYYNNSDLIKCESGNISEILSIEEIKNES